MDDEAGDGEAQGGVAVFWFAVGVASELSVVAEPGVGGFDDPAFAEPDERDGSCAALFAWWRDEVVDAVGGELFRCGGVVEPAVGVQGANPFDQVAFVDLVEEREQHGVVVAVPGVDVPSERDPFGVDRETPFPCQSPGVFDAVTCAFASTRGEVVGPVDRHMVEVQANQVVVAGNGMCGELFEHTSINPFVSSGPQRGVRHLVTSEMVHHPFGAFP